MYKIAISGKANSGKNTVASMLVEFLKYKNSKEKIVALADPMKHIVKIMHPEALDECLWGPSELRSNIISEKYLNEFGKPLTYREALINLGAYGRKYHRDIWLNALVKDATKSEDVNAYIVSDVRFVNEFKYLKEAGFTMIRVLRDDCAVIDDISEKEQEAIKDKEFDHVINNNKTIEYLRDEVKLLSLKLAGLM